MELIKKLRLNIDQPLWLINAPADCTDLFSQFEMKEKISGKTPMGQLILFVLNSEELEHELSVLAGHISPETLFWICYPKKSGSITSDLIQMKAWDIVFQSGFRGQTSVSFNEDWSAMRFTNAPKKAPSICDLPMEERKVEGIDFVNRTAQLPADAVAIVNRHKGMLSFFNSMSFTCKKEYIQAIADAKKEETRKRRIEKMVEMMQQKMSVH